MCNKNIFTPRGNEATTAECIVSAQIASDTEKNRQAAEAFWGDIPWASEPMSGGYGVKPFYIYRAMMTILQDSESRFRFSVKKMDDQNGQPSYVVAFRHRFLEGEGKEPIIAFHLPAKQGTEVKKFMQSSMQFSFDAAEGVTSRGNARRLAQDLGWCESRKKEKVA